MSELSPLRVGRITGSRVGAILGLKGAFSTRSQVLRDMVREHHGLPDEWKGGPEADWGNEHEGDAIMAYEAERGVTVHGGQEIVLHPFYDFLAITPDGLVGEDGGLEVKCPYRARYTSIWEKPHYEAQLRLSLECTGRSWWDFGVWRKNKPISISRVDFDPNWLPSVLPQLLDFMAEYQLAINDPVVLAREKGRGLCTEATDPDQLLADRARWKQLVEQEIPAAQAELDEIKERVGVQLGDSETVSVDGEPVAKWIYRGGSSLFDRAGFKLIHPELEAQFSKRGEASKFPVLVTNDQQGDPT